MKDTCPRHSKTKSIVRGGVAMCPDCYWEKEKAREKGKDNSVCGSDTGVKPNVS